MRLPHYTADVHLDLDKLIHSYGLRPGTVVHAGASICQEAKIYSLGLFSPVYWIEALDDVGKKATASLADFPGQVVIVATLWSRVGKRVCFNRASNEGESSSVFRMKFHKSFFPSVQETVSEFHVTTTLDSLACEYNFGHISLLVLDLQGAELEALKGAINLLGSVDCVFTEVSSISMYKGQALFREIHNFMIRNGFHLVDHDLRGNKVMGDAIYLSSDSISRYSLVPIPFPAQLPKLSMKRRIFYVLRVLRIPADLLRSRSKP